MNSSRNVIGMIVVVMMVLGLCRMWVRECCVSVMVLFRVWVVMWLVFCGCCVFW